MTHYLGEQTDAFPTSDPVTECAPVGAIQVLRLPQVCRITGLCRSSIYQMEAEGRFPRRVKIGARSVGWIESEVQSWLRQKIESGRSRKP
jgi:prophage regulatory protein